MSNVNRPPLYMYDDLIISRPHMTYEQFRKEFMGDWKITQPVVKDKRGACDSRQSENDEVALINKELY